MMMTQLGGIACLLPKLHLIYGITMFAEEVLDLGELDWHNLEHYTVL